MHLSRGYTLTDAWRAAEHIPLRILLADDDAELRGQVASDLSQNGSQVVEVEDGRQALEVFRRSFEADPSHWFDVVVSDLKMPNLSGLELLAALRAECPFVPFILMTAFVDRQVKERALELGAWTILQKPVDLESLYLAVHRAI
jgi:two-component system C4-dicarboxylate transport response regulator DctD